VVGVLSTQLLFEQLVRGWTAPKTPVMKTVVER
jgi:hypothetical protein